MSQQRELTVSRILTLLGWVFLFYVAWQVFFGGLGFGLGLGISLASFGVLIVLLIKLLFVVFVIALLVSIYQLAKRVLFPETGKSLKDYSEPIVSKVKEQYNVFTNKVECPGCHQSVGNTYRYCPYCAAQLKHTCGRCGATLDPAWQCCPYCGPEAE